MNESQQKKVKELLESYSKHRGQFQAIELCDLLVETNYSFTPSPSAAMPPPAAPTEVPYPNARFLLKKKDGTGGAKHSAKCFKCSEIYPAGEEVFWVEGKGCFHPFGKCCSDAERTFYKNKNTFFYNYLIRTGQIQRKTRERV